MVPRLLPLWDELDRVLSQLPGELANHLWG
jgi:hypothetical protein